MTPLEQYIDAQIKNGYSKSQIKQYLIQQGYKEKDIDIALTNLSTSQSATNLTQPISQATTPSKPNQKELMKTQLTSYVLTYLQQGYKVDQLFNYLKTQRYDEKLLKAVFKQINNQYYQGQMQSSILHEHTLSTKSVMKVGIMFLFIFLILGGIYVFSQGLIGGSGNEKLLDIKATPLKEELVGNDILTFEVDLINQGSKGRVDVDLEYKIRDSNSNLIKKEQDTRALETTLQFQKKLSIQNLKSGLYTVQVSAKYEEKVAVTTFSFSYKENEEDVVPKIPEKPPEEINKPKEEQTTLKDEEIITPIAAKDTKGEDNHDIFDFALTQDDKKDALSYCAGITDIDLKSECYYTIAQQHKDPNICEIVNSTERKEDCYMNFVMAGNESYCDKVTLPENQQLCEQFIYLKKVKSYFDDDDKKGLSNYLDLPDYKKPTQKEINDSKPELDDMGIVDFIN